jgi:hypothetical protein
MIRSIQASSVAVLTAAVVLTSAAPASAAFAIRFASGSTVLVINDGDGNDAAPSDSNTITVDSAPTNTAVQNFISATGFDIRGFTTSISNSNNSFLTTAGGGVVYNGAGQGTLVVTAGNDAYTLPAGGLLAVDSSASFTLVNGPTAGSNFNYRAFTDNVGPALNLASPNGSFHDVGQINFTNVPPGTLQSTAPTLMFNRTTPQFQITGRSTFVLNAGESVTGTASTVVTATPVPGPAGLFLALTAVPTLGLGAWVRRRKVAA